MGRDKALLSIGGATLLERAVDTVRAAGGSPLILGSLRAQGMPGRIAGVRWLDETMEGGSASGPLPALRLGLQACGTASAVALACDLPLVPAGLLRLLAEEIAHHDAVVPRASGELQVLAAAYAGSCLPAIDRHLRSGRGSVHGFLAEVRCRILEEGDLEPFGGEAIFLNVNTPRDIERAEALLKGAP
jgi:molybdopterin-guanine dinucleotide biosynthesis protein A